MPKKFGTNTKKEEARERKKQKKKDEKERKEKEAEDEYWREKDPKILEKQAEKKRKEREKEEKQREKQRLKEELKKEEEEALNSKKKSKNQVSAPTRKQIQQYEEERIQKLLKEKEHKEDEKDHNPNDDIDVEKEFVNENYGKLEKKTDQGVDIIEATGLDSALQEMNLEDYDRHPEKRMRQAWNDYFEKQLPIFKEQYPNLKRQQYIQMIQKEFKTSPDNPVYMRKIQDSKKAQEKEEDEK